MAIGEPAHPEAGRSAVGRASDGPPATVAVSMGDPFGIGPEVLARALADPRRQHAARWVVFGWAEAWRRAARAAGLPDLGSWVAIEPDVPSEPRVGVTLIDLATPTELDDAERQDAWDRPRALALGGGTSRTFLERAIECARSARARGQPAAILTGPVNKSAWLLADPSAPPGHTEVLARALGAPAVAMLFVGRVMRVILATGHIPLARVPARLTTDGIVSTAMLGHDSCRRLGIDRPRVAVCGLNPHAGEGGAMGTEDDAVIRPAVERLRSAGIDATGPWPGDAIFPAAARGACDLVVAMYHDQGLIPIKTLERDACVHVTAGLPIARTSPAHGTAYDIAGRGRAEWGSAAASADLALRLAGR